VVYKARHPSLNKLVALKLLSPNQNLLDLLGPREVRRRFESEALIMARIRHPNLCDVWDFDEAEGRPFLVMEYYCNNLGIMMGERREVERPSRGIPVEKAIYYTRQTLLGLARLHQAGVVHRDVKPLNILLTDADEVKIIDFGLSKPVNQRESPPRNLVIGSPYYSAPEQRIDPDRVEVDADIYSVGMMLYRMLTGRIRSPVPEALRSFNPDLDPAWDVYIDRLTAPEPRRRIRTAREALEGLDVLFHAWTRERARQCTSLQGDIQDAASRTGAPVWPVRSVPVKVKESEAGRAFGLDSLRRPKRRVRNRFHKGQDGTVADAATGLVWELEGSLHPLTWYEAREYGEELGRSRFGGRADWRLPTVDELITIMRPMTSGTGRCIAAVFDGPRERLWSSDLRSFAAAWYVDLQLGFVNAQDLRCHYYVRAVSSLSPTA